MSRKRVDALLAPLDRLGVRLDLAPMRRLLAALGDPQAGLAIVLVAGTNGKGSTAAMLAAIARAAGYRVALHTSPHLVRVEERVVVDGEPVDPARLAAALERVLAVAGAAGPLGPTYFEATVAAAFVLFAEQQPDLAVVEIGMGGRLDATNAAEPLLSVITPIALDHTAELGTTLRAVAGEKAGILRRDRPAVFARQAPEAERALLEAAARIGARAHRREALVRQIRAQWRGLDGHLVEFELAGQSLEVELSLPGEHQLENAATAVAAAHLLTAEGALKVDPAAIRGGLSTVCWPGRLEPFRPADGGPTVLLDAAHNPHGCAALARFLDRLDRPFTLLFGALADKQIAEMLPELAQRARQVVLTRPDSARAADPADLRALVPAGRPVEVEPDPERALAVARSAPPDLVVACGSLYLLGVLRPLLAEDRKEPPRS